MASSSGSKFSKIYAWMYKNNQKSIHMLLDLFLFIFGFLLYAPKYGKVESPYESYFYLGCTAISAILFAWRAVQQTYKKVIVFFFISKFLNSSAISCST